ncbi:MAG: FAD-binding oxidoreductase [Ekhidna sp.]
MKEIADYQLNVTEFSKRDIPKVWKPYDVSELKDILQLANKNKTAVHPISTGHNWGLGSKLPVTDCEIVDLSNINEILEVNEDLCYARIQPGVTQKQLSDYLKCNHPRLMLNVTGSDAHSSILGNTIERGSGKNGQRASDLRELKILLANGEEISSGFGENTDESFYKYGIGPDITHLFTQSNFGIVTQGVIDLMIKQPYSLFLVGIEHARLRDFISQFSLLVRKNVVGNSLELDSQNDPKIFELFEGNENIKNDEWTGWFVIYGESEIREAKKKYLIQSIDASTSNIKIFDSELDNEGCPIPVQVRLERYSGIPSDHSLLATAKAFGIELNNKNLDIDFHKEMPGFRCVLPVLPFSSSAVDIIDFINKFSSKKSYQPAISIIGLNPYALEVFVRVFLNRSDQEEIDKAAEWSYSLLLALKEKNVFPYRLDIESMEPYLNEIGGTSQVWKSRIKNLFDPNQVISPKRYQIII